MLKLFKNIIVLIPIVFLIFFIYKTKDLKLDASSDTLILKDDKTFKYFEYYNEIFPSRNFLVLAVKDSKKIDKVYIENIKIVKKQIEEIENVESTFSIIDVPILLLNNLKISDLASQSIENIDNSKRDLNNILKEFSSSPIFKNQIINENMNLSSILIYIEKNKKLENLKNEIKINKNSSLSKEYLKEKENNNIAKEKIIKDIRRIINNQNNDYIYFLGGIDMISSDTINFVKKDIINFSVAVLIFIIIVLFIIYREIKWVIIPLFSTTYAVFTMTGLVGLLNWEITAISSNFISLMLILSISMNIHIINHYKINYSYYKNNQLKKTIKNMFWPCFYTALTTVVAFASLLFSNIKPIIDFGSIMIFALIITLITSFTILPIMIYYFPKININKNKPFKVLNIFYNFSIKNSNKILATNILILLISILGIYKLNVENSFINYFKSNTEIYKGMKLIDKELGGTTPIDIIIKFNEKENESIDTNQINSELDEDFDIGEDLDLSEDLFINTETDTSWFSEDKINSIKTIHKYLESKNEIGKVQSLYSLIDMANLINKDQLSIFELSILYNEIPENYKNLLLDPYLSIDNKMKKITARIKDSNEINRNNLIKETENYIESNFTNINKFEVNGLLVLYNNMLQSLFSSQIKSFGIILISIFFMFLILFGSIKLSIIGIIPNIIASSFILGIIGLYGIPLDIMTITIAAITIGIAVDNTIHYIYRIKEGHKKSITSSELIKTTHNNVGNAVLTTSLTIAFGFSVLCLSNFIPTILFGTFTALAMIIAMLGVLITLPSIINKYLYVNK